MRAAARAERPADPPGHLRLNTEEQACAGSSDTSAGATACRCWWRAFSGSSTAAMTRPAWPWSRTARCASTRPRVVCATWRPGCPNGSNGPVGVAHTRWATHGPPSDVNAHPHVDAEGRVAVVHNGILENADELRAELVADGVELVSDTDTEVLAHLIARSDEAELEDRVRAALRRVVGAYGLAVLRRRRARPADRGPQRLARRDRHRRPRDVRRLRRRRARAPHPAGRLPRRRRAGHGHGRRLSLLDARPPPDHQGDPGGRGHRAGLRAARLRHLPAQGDRRPAAVGRRHPARAARTTASPPPTSTA